MDYNEKKTVLWVGRYAYMKKPYLFLDLCNSFPSYHFTIICTKSATLADEYSKLKEDASKLKNLIFIEKVPFLEIQEYFDKAKVFVNTSDFEGYPNTFIQSGAAKTPILSYKVNPDDFINNFNCGFVCNGSFEKMVDNLRVLLEDKDEWKKKSDNVFSYVRKRHQFDVNIKIIKSLISEQFKLTH